MFVCQGLCTGIQGIYALLIGGSIGQQWCSGIQGIYSQFTGGPLAKVGLSAKFDVVVFKASILDSVGGPLAKVGSSAKSGVLVLKASLFCYLGGHWPKKVCLPSLA